MTPEDMAGFPSDLMWEAEAPTVGPAPPAEGDLYPPALYPRGLPSRERIAAHTARTNQWLAARGVGPGHGGYWHVVGRHGLSLWRLGIGQDGGIWNSEAGHPVGPEEPWLSFRPCLPDGTPCVGP